MPNRSALTQALLIALLAGFAQGQKRNPAPPPADGRLHEIVGKVSAQRIEATIEKLVSFGTRHTLSDTLSDTRGIGAARRWIKAEFDLIKKDRRGKLEVFFHRTMLDSGANRRIVKDVEIVNVIAIQRGRRYPNRYIIMAGDIDNRVSNPVDYTSDSPGANDNASGMAGVIEAARVLSQYDFDASILYAGLSGEEQGLFGGKFLAQTAVEEGWDIIGVLNNDMIGNIEGLDGVIDNSSFRVFSEPTPVTESEESRRRRRFTGGEVDGVSRQLARYVDRLAAHYMDNLDAMMIYRLDRFGRGGHHRPFNDAGFAGVRIMETHENYTRQHQDIRMEDGIAYGDVLSGVNFEYAARLTAVNAIVLASLAWAPQQPKQVTIRGAVRPSPTLSWEASRDRNRAGYKVYWRATTAPQWEHWRWVGQVDSYAFENIIIDNHLFGVAAVNKDGHESVIVFPGGN